MKDYYELLNVENTADAQQIKRAYFKCVRQYPPERFPEEFKEIRVAYETLSDAEKRAEYDRAAALPDDIRGRFNDAMQAREQGRFEKAELDFRAILKCYPGLSNVKVELAHTLEAMEKTGKAISVWEELCAGDPGNIEYMLELANCYRIRSWRKKSLEQYKRVIGMDRDNDDAWMGLLSCYGDMNEVAEMRKISKQIAEIFKDKSKVSIQLYSCVCVLNLNYDTSLAEEFLQRIVRLLREHRDIAQSDGEAAVMLLLNSIMASDNIKMFPYIQNMAKAVPYIRDEIRDSLTAASSIFDIETICDNGFSELFHDLFALLSEGIDSKIDKLELAAMESHILSDMKMYGPQLHKLKEAYPQLYGLHSSFFDDVFTRNSGYMLSKRLKMLSKSGLSPEDFQDDLDDDELIFTHETIYREEPKVGRNDPCPCGSGKKYKRCCGT